MEDSQIPLNRDGDGHEDAASEENIVEGVEEVWEEAVMDLGGQTTEWRSVCWMIFKSAADTLSYAHNKEEKIKYCESDEKVVEVALKAFVTEDRYGQNISTHPEGCQGNGGIASH